MTAADVGRVLGFGFVVAFRRGWRPVLAMLGLAVFFSAVARVSPVAAQALVGLCVAALAVVGPALSLLRRRT